MTFLEDTLDNSSFGTLVTIFFDVTHLLAVCVLRLTTSTLSSSSRHHRRNLDSPSSIFNFYLCGNVKKFGNQAVC